METYAKPGLKYKIITPICRKCGEKGEKKVKTHFLDKEGWVCSNCWRSQITANFLNKLI